MSRTAVRIKVLPRRNIIEPRDEQRARFLLARAGVEVSAENVRDLLLGRLVVIEEPIYPTLQPATPSRAPLLSRLAARA